MLFRYLLSGSDYGERKLVIWNSKYPLIEDPVQLPHMIFWNSEAQIRKILIKQAIPERTFWLNAVQLNDIPEDIEIVPWYGENETDEPVLSDSEEEEGEEAEVARQKKLDRENFGKDDVKEVDGLLLSVDALDEEERRSSATEYQPGGQLLVSVQVRAYIFFRNMFVA